MAKKETIPTTTIAVELETVNDVKRFIVGKGVTLGNYTKQALIGKMATDSVNKNNKPNELNVTD